MTRKLFFAGVGMFFGLFLVVPVVTVFVRAFSGLGPGGVLAAVWQTLTAPQTGTIIGFTVGQALVSALAGTLLALPVAYMISHYRFRGRRFLFSLSLVPFVLPSIIVVVCMISFYGQSGLINTVLGTDFNLVYNFRGIVLAHVFYNFSLATRVVATSWQSIDKRFRETAESLGDEKRGIFFRVTLPLLAPALITGFVLIFIYTFLSFGIILVFGGIRYATLEVAIYQEMFINLDLSAAAVYALVQLLFSFLFLRLSSSSLHAARGSAPGSEETLPPLATARPTARWSMRVYSVLIVLFVLGPILTMFARAFNSLSGSLSLENFRELLFPAAGERNVQSVLRSSVPGVILRSLGIAAASGTLTMIVASGLAVALRGKRATIWESLLQLPIGISLVTVSLGLRLFWSGIVPPLLLIVVGQFFVAFPLVFRILRSGVEELPESQIQAAAILGASRWRTFREIEFPLLKRTFLNGYAYALALPFADLTVVLAAGQGRIATFPVAIYRLIGFRSFDLALALSVIYILLCLALFAVIDATSFSRSTR
jgi:thiamine transport system permease protein